MEVLLLGDLLASSWEATIDAHREAGDRLGEHSNAGQDDTAFEGRLGTDGDSGDRPSCVDDFLENAGDIAPHLDQVGDFVVLWSGGVLHKRQNTTSCGSSSGPTASPEASPRAITQATGASIRAVEWEWDFVGFIFPASSVRT